MKKLLLIFPATLLISCSTIQKIDSENITSKTKDIINIYQNVKSVYILAMGLI